MPPPAPTWASDQLSVSDTRGAPRIRPGRPFARSRMRGRHNRSSRSSWRTDCVDHAPLAGGGSGRCRRPSGSAAAINVPPAIDLSRAVVVRCGGASSATSSPPSVTSTVTPVRTCCAAAPDTGCAARSDRSAETGRKCSAVRRAGPVVAKGSTPDHGRAPASGLSGSGAAASARSSSRRVATCSSATTRSCCRIAGARSASHGASRVGDPAREGGWHVGAEAVEVVAGAHAPRPRTGPGRHVRHDAQALAVEVAVVVQPGTEVRGAAQGAAPRCSASPTYTPAAGIGCRTGAAPSPGCSDSPPPISPTAPR